MRMDLEKEFVEIELRKDWWIVTALSYAKRSPSVLDVVYILSEIVGGVELLYSIAKYREVIILHVFLCIIYVYTV